ncbi:MAG TPA: tetratricopeptide repeat protein, partial [Myxococcus sp.]|nr:tetratricopeptide repeat protein [Myxococcus sp.]
LRLDLRLQEAESGETVVQVTERGTEKDLLSLVSRVGGTLRARLGMAPLTTEQVLSVRSTLPVSPGSSRLYAEGLAALRGRSPATAVERLEQVVALEPGFAPAHSALASAFKQLFLEGRAREAARRAHELSAGLPREERLLVEARHHAASASWERAIEAYRTLFEFFPDNLEYGIELANSQRGAGQHREALDTLDRLRRLPPPMGEDARIDYAAALATVDAGDYATARQHAGRAVARARQAGQTQMVAHALTYEAFALRNLGEPSEAVARMAEAERLFSGGGDRGGAALTRLMRAIVLTDWVRFHEAEAVYADALRSSAEFRGSSLEAEALVNAGWLRCHLGHQDGAVDFTTEARELFRELGNHRDEVSATIQLGMVRRRRGELQVAQALLEEGVEASRASLQDDYHEAWARYELGHLLLDRGWPKLAREPLERALALRKGRGLRAFVAETELALARLELAEGRPQRALAWAGSARAEYWAQRLPDKEGLAWAMVARVLLDMGDIAGAREAMAHARALAGKSENIFIAAEVALAGARLALRDGPPEQKRVAARELDALAQRFSTGGMPGVALEARLTALELARAQGAPSWREDVRAVAAEAFRLGYLELARRAGVMARD